MALLFGRTGTISSSLPFIFTITNVPDHLYMQLPLVAGGTYDFTVDWGDGSSSNITVWNQAETTHVYPTIATYTITITGTIIGWEVGYYTSRGIITELKQWGCLRFIDSVNGYFYGCSNLTITATDMPDLTGLTNLNKMFASCFTIVTIPHMNDWDVSSVTNMSNMFSTCYEFNQDLSGWDVSFVTTMASMFFACYNFNQDISSWDVSSVTDMSDMFRSAYVFNQDLSGWDVSSVTTMARMFSRALVFNQDIGGWDVSSVTDMASMFYLVTLSTANYDALLIGWASQDVQDDVVFGGGNSAYSTGDAEAARTHLTDDHGWTITDGGIKSFNFTITTVTTPDTFTLPLVAGGTYNFVVSWGDGTSSTITAWNQVAKTHTYATTNTYTISITGTITGWNFGGVGDFALMKVIKQWDCLRLIDSTDGYFNGCSNLTITATDILDLTGITHLNYMFGGCVQIVTIPSINSWDVSAVTSMYNMFGNCLAFNQDIGDWDVSSVTNMSGMFANCSVFNKDIGDWDVSAVTDMSQMFLSCTAFNQDIGDWDVSSVTTMRQMFVRTTNFNQDISGWDISNVTNMTQMFMECTAFNQDIGDWDVSNVEQIREMFKWCVAFNQDIGDWDVGKARNMEGMFNHCSAFNQDIGDWDTSSVLQMDAMFNAATHFNQDISSWDVSSVTVSEAGFSMENMFKGVTLSTANYNALLVGWSAQDVQADVVFNGGNSKYTGGGAAEAARTHLTDDHGWTITDGGAL